MSAAGGNIEPADGPDPLMDMEKASSSSWNLMVPLLSWSNTLASAHSHALIHRKV